MSDRTKEAAGGQLLMGFIAVVWSLAAFVVTSGCDRKPDSQASGPAQPYAVIPAEEPLPRGERLLGINISESERGFGPSFEVAQQAGVQVVELNIPWNVIETSEGQYEDPWGVLGAIPFYGQKGIRVMFSLAVINTVESTAPDYVRGSAWDSPEMIAAFNSMMDWFLAHIPAGVTVPGIAIGNEVDLLLSSEEQWKSYTRFFRAACEHVRSARPRIRLGVKTTVMEGALGKWSSEVQAINRDADVVMLNYYPQDDGFRVRAPDVVYEHFNQVAAVFEGREIWFTELGYQSGREHCGSSETKQARFYHHLFGAWDRHRGQIGLVLINWLHDQSPEKIAEFTEYYGSSAPAFVKFLSTLGLRNYDHTDKPAWKQVVAEAEARGW